MTTSSRGIASVGPAFPRFLRIAGHWINSYKVFLCVGIYAGILTSAIVGERSGLSPLRLGIGLLLLAVVGMIGARLYHLATHAQGYRGTRFGLTPRDPAEGGWSVFGGLLVVPASLLIEPILDLPFGTFWDHMAIAIAVGGMWIRFGCICNGCCVGRASGAWYALRQHDVHGVYRRRIPVQWLEIGWWGLACIGLAWLWPRELPTGSYAFLVLGWYGLGRSWLEPLRLDSAVLYGIRVNQAVAALLAIAAVAGLLWRTT